MSTVPETVMDEWRAKAEDNESLRRRHHKQQRWGYKHDCPYEECWDCQRQMAKCKSKVRHETIDTAWDHCIEMWPEKRVVPYRCYWSEGLHWHVSTAHGSADRRKIRRRVIRRLAKPNIST